MYFFSQSSNAGRGAFFRADIHGNSIPADAVGITPRKHKELLAGQSAGRAIVAGPGGHPKLAPVARHTAKSELPLAIARIKAEAGRRILAVASLERQTNDNAAIARRALELASGFSPTDQPGFAGAYDRRSRIDWIRRHSDEAEAAIATWSAASLTTFDPTDARWWPEWSAR